MKNTKVEESSEKKAVKFEICGSSRKSHESIKLSGGRVAEYMIMCVCIQDL